MRRRKKLIYTGPTIECVKGFAHKTKSAAFEVFCFLWFVAPFVGIIVLLAMCAFGCFGGGILANGG